MAQRFTWTASADRAELEAVGRRVVAFAELVADAEAWAKSAEGRRDSLASIAEPWLRTFDGRRPLAVLGVRLEDLQSLRVLHGQVLEPALRTGTPLLVESEHRLSRLDPAAFVDEGFAYPYTLERALHAAMGLHRGDEEPRVEQRVPHAAVALDSEQRRAADAHDGVVQVIAPAGSGKTTVLVERVRVLLARGTPPGRILCTTFNKDAQVELQARLAVAGLGAVQARTFHSLGLGLLREEGLARPDTRPLTLSLAQWKRLSAIASRDHGVWVEAADARAAIGEIKLGMLCTPEEFRRRARELPDGETIARIYELYERHLEEEGRNDFDDHVLLAVRALREDAELRARWQARFSRVLVDEYQDIEPAQELLVRILAAPQDGLFCVGDEDQTLYGWRRASVRRIIGLDLEYPGLERISLAHNYRCPPAVVDASRRLVEHNAVRFPKPIHAAPGRAAEDGAIVLREHGAQPETASVIVQSLVGRARGEVVVLARTTNLLRTVALACVDVGVRISAPDPVFESRGARQALEAYLRLCGDPRSADPEDVAVAFRAPNRGLPYDAAARVAGLLRDGRSFADALAGLDADARRRRKLDDAAVLLDRLTRMTDATRFVRQLRTVGGLDEHFTEQEDAYAGTEQVELEILEQAQAEAAGRTVAQYSALLRRRGDALRAIRDEEHGIELTTIHRAKGREWPRVELFACEENQLPHRHAFEASEEEQAAGEGVEAERRLAYVAFTRARERLAVSTTISAASRFLTEAGLEPARPYVVPAAPAPPRVSTSRPERSATRRSAPKPAPRLPPKAAAKPRDTSPLARARRTGLVHVLRAAEDPATALQIAADAVEQKLVGAPTGSQRMTLADLLDAIDALEPERRETIVGARGIRSEQVLVSRLDAGGRKSLARALRSAA